ncbi:hypothetical protein [Bradyrhizobium sp. NAS80.1]|uniref:hypothetical protein n=1 Tax=Bradyrhizobium sp. NAS80.1 TaxID=1680159 RepID=UPI000AA1CDA7|nr:hypothetical protein [Bradyrhizobium sp. NAS80.1]
MADLRIFSYLPNPRVWKATIAARFCAVDVEIRGASGRELRDWLWDYDARPLAEHERQSLSSLARTGWHLADFYQPCGLCVQQQVSRASFAPSYSTP